MVRHDAVIAKVDPFDKAAFDAWHATQFTADRFGREEHATPWQREESRADKQTEMVSRSTAAHALVVDGMVVTAAELSLPLLDNLDLAEVAIHTHPDYRHLGYATEMLAYVEGVVRADGRTKLLAEAAYPYDAPANGAGQPGADFLTSRGFEFGLADVKRVLDLPVNDKILAGLSAQAAPHHETYSIRSFAGPVPEEFAEQYADMDALVVTDAPMGGIDLEPAVADVREVRENEALMQRQRRARYTTLALDADGSVVAYTDLLMPDEDPGAVFQSGTLVRREHRGHRLGLAVKVENLRFLQAQRDDGRILTTYNAEINDHMVRVNEEMGFRPVERLGEFQKRLP